MFNASNVLISANSNFSEEIAGAITGGSNGVLQVFTSLASPTIAAGVSVYGHSYSSMLVSAHQPYYQLNRPGGSNYNIYISPANALCIGTSNGLSTENTTTHMRIQGSTGIVYVGNDKSVLYSKSGSSIMVSTVGDSSHSLATTGGFETVGSAYFRASNGDPIMFLANQSAFLGIGTTQPVARLDTRGDAIFSCNMGAGTTNPQAPLHITGLSYIQGNVGIGTTLFWDRLSILGSGIVSQNVGIGTIAPRAALDVSTIGLVSGNLGIGTTIPGPYSLRAQGPVLSGGAWTISSTLAATTLGGPLAGVANSAIIASNAFGDVGGTIPASFVITSNIVVLGTLSMPGSSTTITSSNITMSTYMSTTSNVLIRNTNPEVIALRVQQSGASSQAASFYSGTQPRLVIGGNVGVGTGIPVATLHVQDGGYYRGSIGIGITTPSSSLGLAGDLVVSGSIGIGTTRPPASLSIMSRAYLSGNVGIGTTIANSTLHVGSTMVPRRQPNLFTGTAFDSKVLVNGSNYARFGVGGGISLHTVGLDGSGGMYAWGNNEFGQLGNGTTTSVLSPIPVSISGRMVAGVACGGYHTVAIDSAGSVYAWGYNNHGQLGNGTNDTATSPLLVSIYGSLSGATTVAVSCGLYHSVAVDSSGALHTWGNNVFGQLGRTGTTGLPAQVPRASFLGSNIVSAACGSIHTLAVDTGGSVYAWGFNGAGELGNNAQSNNQPTPVNTSSYGSLTGVAAVAVACGGYHSAALDTTGGVHTWGYNGYGQLGNNTTTNSSVPVLISSQGSLSGRNIVSIACGNTHMAALDNTSTVHTWGLNGTGQLGNNTTTNSLVPINVSTYGSLLGTTIVSVACGYYHTAGLDDVGNVYTWGYNGYGQIGDSSTTSRSVPVYSVQLSEDQVLRTALPYALVGTSVAFAGSNQLVPSANGRIDSVSITAMNSRARTSYASASNCAALWYSRTSAADNEWRSVCWAPELSLFCSVATTGTANRVMTSPDGITWTTQSTSGLDNEWRSVCWARGLSLFCAVSSSGTGDRVMTSPDGITWTSSTSAADDAWQSVCWSEELSLLCAVSSDGSVMVSSNGTLWTAITNITISTRVAYGWTSVCWSPDLSLFCAVSLGKAAMTSRDGTTWTVHTMQTGYQWSSVCWSPELSLFCAVSDTTNAGNRIMTSPDGMNWTIRIAPADLAWVSVCWSPDLSLFSAVSSSGTGARVMTSPDGIVWKLSPTPADNDYRSVCWAPELSLFASVASSGSSNRAMTSRIGMPSSLGTVMATSIRVSQNVGIGTTTPVGLLQVQGGTLFTANVGVGTTTVGLPLWVNGGGIVIGSVGIGTTLPVSRLSLPAGTTTVAPLLVSSGTLLGTSSSGSMEYDGSVFYLSGSARGVATSEQVAILQAASLLASSTSPQPLLPVVGGGNGAVSVPAGVYMFDTRFTLSNMDAISSSFGFGFGGTATISSQAWWASATKTGTPTIGTYTATETSLVAADTNTSAIAQVKGVVRVSAAGTLVPQVSTTAAHTAAYVGANSYLRMRPVSGPPGTSGVLVGNWS
jgi:alpha-tubulin suppressor-like RCC1 family protein